ncbi:YhfC family intramembrane metalloprotease [Desulfurococcaceae archaeon MEX13E-LK6-19]|nr:YhfC family intramembrane metalloprotease [Desulfurococcaceae archaeon MEX13E-LK6-19]
MSLEVPGVVASLVIAVVPGFVVLCWMAGRNGFKWLAALVGGFGWFLALLLRYPVFIPMVIYMGATSVVGYIQAGLAGVFEEPVRYFVIKYFYRETGEKRIVYCIGLGWGLMEALVLYVLNVLVAYMMGTSLILENLVAGAIERNIALLFHVSAAMIIFVGIKSGDVIKYLLLAIILHGLLNIAAVYLLYVIANPLLIEAVLGLIVVTVYMLAYFLMHRMD